LNLLPGWNAKAKKETAKRKKQRQSMSSCKTGETQKTTETRKEKAENRTTVWRENERDELNLVNCSACTIAS